MQDRNLKLLFLLACVLMLALRVFDLTSDNSYRIDFSLGQLTDESYYTMNAKNQALFGQERLDGFNNMLLSPALHYVHEANFRLFGVGMVQARSVSVLFGLLTVATLFWVLLEAAGLRTAIFGALLLGLEHVFLLFNRQALMDTPSCFPAMVALLCFVKAQKSDRNVAWLVGCGLAIAVAVTTRNQQAGLLVAPFAGIAFLGRPKREHAFVAVGLIVGLAVYAAVWFLPHRADILHMNTYYRAEQWGPKSIKEVVKNVAKAFLRPEGEVGYFVRHSLVTVLGALLGLLALPKLRKASMSPGVSAAAAFSGAAFLAMAASFAVINYAPGRYLMILLPPMTVLAVVGWSHLSQVSWDGLGRWLVMGLEFLICYHLLSVLLEVAHIAGYEQRRTAVKILLRAVNAAALVCLLQVSFARPPWLVGRKIVLGAFLVMQAGYLGDWFIHRTHQQFEFGRWAAANLPENAVVINGVYLGLEGRSRILSILPRLCNDEHPIVRFGDKPLYLIVTHEQPETAPRVILGDPVPKPELIRSTEAMGYTIDLYQLGRSH